MVIYVAIPGDRNVIKKEAKKILKYKGKVKVQFTLEQSTKAQRGSRGIALLFL
jgi:hypothetical protein